MSHIGTEARLAQRRAADPGGAAWVAANAGSGKTRVLTERVARLLLDGAPPGKILCLTYTKAAAAEMQDRLFRMLGGWAMADDAALQSDLSDLVGANVTVDADRARRLFAEALETPGGLKIQTIHAFCDALLRRFPLEAGAPPGFRVMDTREQVRLIRDVMDDMAAEEPRGGSGPFAQIAAIMDESSIEKLAREVVSNRTLFPALIDEAEIAARFGTPAPPDPVTARFVALDAMDRRALDRMIAAWQAGTKTDNARAISLLEARARGDDDLGLEIMAALLKQDGEPRKNPATKAAQKAEPYWEALCNHLIDVALAIREAGLAAAAAERTIRLAQFGGSFITRYEANKAALSLLDFDDLVGKTRMLLTSSEMAQWALYRLDGGIDHILVDEAQDTSPAQWDVIDAIVGEFTAGEGARDAERTAFVVGDEKQSIYSFQGAEPGKFSQMRDAFSTRFAAVGGLREEALRASFRSAPAILRAVDATFAGERAAGLTAANTAPEHVAFHDKRAGRVELWPLVQPDPESLDPDPWSPVDMPGKRDARLRLAELIADEVANLIATAHLPGDGRKVEPGDIIILLQTRKPMMAPLIRFLKQRKVPVAGADRLALIDELVVKDLLALMRVAVTPGDDLSLASLLRSPLCSVTEQGLFELAHDRPGSLWSALQARQADWPDEVNLIKSAIKNADFIRPYEFLETVLIGRKGRQQLLARLGPEADDPIDELLAQALAYETAEPPSLTGFLKWITGDDAEISREQDSVRNEVRVMSAHGAKGLEAPIVILPDTLRKPGASDQNKVAEVDTPDGPRGVWRMPSREEPELLVRMRAQKAEKVAAEHRRLLYVAMTRAEDWLIVAGAGDVTDKKLEGTWYQQVADGFETLNCQNRTVPGLDGQVQVLAGDGDAKDGQPVTAVAHPAIAALPQWVAKKPPVAANRSLRRAASALTEEAEFQNKGPYPPELARRRGEAIHAVLELGTEDPAVVRRTIAAFELERDVAEAAGAEALRARQFLDAEVFFGAAAMAEVGISVVEGDARIVGRIDRMIVTPDRIDFVDFKSDAVPPAHHTDIPPSYLAQMAAYRAALVGLYPYREVAAHILWTALPRLDQMETQAMENALGAALSEMVP